VWPELLPFLKDWGPSGLILVAVLMGWLVPRWFHKERIADKDQQIATLTAALERVERQRDELTELARTTVKVVEALPTREPL
jgi:hypothetical protein